MANRYSKPPEDPYATRVVSQDPYETVIDRKLAPGENTDLPKGGYAMETIRGPGVSPRDPYEPKTPTTRSYTNFDERGGRNPYKYYNRDDWRAQEEKYGKEFMAHYDLLREGGRSPEQAHAEATNAWLERITNPKGYGKNKKDDPESKRMDSRNKLVMQLMKQGGANGKPLQIDEAIAWADKLVPVIGGQQGAKDELAGNVLDSLGAGVPYSPQSPSVSAPQDVDPRVQAALDAGYTMEEIQAYMGGR